MRLIEDLKAAIGNTPLTEIVFEYNKEEYRIFSKLEYYNLSGSVKDRMAFSILEKAYSSGQIKPNDTIVEATSGNTGIAFCALGAYLNNPVVIYMPDWMSEERKKLISSYGANIRLVTKKEGGFLGSIDLVNEYKDKEGYFLPSQFDNEENVLGQYKLLGKELVENLKSLNLSCDGFVAGVGTGGTVMGVNKALKEEFENVKVCPLEPKESMTMTNGAVGEHRIAGISDEFIPSICKLNELDDIITVNDGDAVLMAQKLARAGLGVGISSGANFIGALKLLKQLGNDKIVTTVFADDSKKYLSTDLMRMEPVKDEYLSKDVNIKRIIVHRN